MQAARAALQSEFDRLVSELAVSRSSVEGLEEQVREEGEREMARCANVISDLQQQLKATEKQWNHTQQEVYRP